MGKHESTKDSCDTAPSDDACDALSPPGDVARAADTPMMALASVEMTKLDAAKIDLATLETPKIESPSIAAAALETAAIEPQNPESLSLDAPGITAVGLDRPAADVLIPPPVDAMTAEIPRADAGSRSHRFPLLAASLVLAASLGAMVGGLVSTSLLVRSTPAPVVVAAKSGIEEVQALKEQVVQVRVDVAALKASIEAGHRNANTQLTKIGERVERIDRTQAEPVAKLTKAIEGFDRRVDSSSARETTGSIAPPQPIPGQPAKQPGVIEGWVLRDVQRGTALIEGRMGLVEVDAGDVVPGLGRVDAIRKQDGRWVVVTPKGLIVPPR